MKYTVLILILFVLSACTANQPTTHIPIPSNTKKTTQKLAVFLDGTNNNESSYTNISKLYNLVSLQDRKDINAVYIKGVGTGFNVLGMAFGAGIDEDVQQAYRFLGENYNSEQADQIYIFGFSRGAYAARILAAFVHVAGIVDLSKTNKRYRKQYVHNLYNAFKSQNPIEARKKYVQTVIEEHTIFMKYVVSKNFKGPETKKDPIKIEFMGLWDTVEALGWPDFKENIDRPNDRYADQLCNIKDAAHAVSVDDNRAEIFTPILLTREHLIEECEESVNIDKVVDEVWFSGAHADIGGGYPGSQIYGVSLNWMLKKVRSHGLINNQLKVFSNPMWNIHDAEKFIGGLVYKRINRNLPRYAKQKLPRDGEETAVTKYNNNKLKIHQSVIDRLEKKHIDSYAFKWMEHQEFARCFDIMEGGYLKLKKNKDPCFTIVDQSYQAEKKKVVLLTPE